MKKVLVILGHPRLESYNAALASAYKKGALKTGAEVKQLDLARLESNQAERTNAMKIGMMKILLAIFFLVLMNPLQAQNIQTLIDEGKYLQAYEDALALADTKNLALASRAAIFYADYLASTEEKADWYDRAEAAAQQSLVLDRNYALAYLYLAQAQGRLGQYRGILQSLNLADEIKKNAEKALELNPELNEAIMTLAIWHSELSSRGVGWLYGASEEKAIELMESISLEEANTFLFHLEYGNILARFQKNEGASKQYQAVLELTPQAATDFAMFELARQALETLENN